MPKRASRSSFQRRKKIATAIRARRIQLGLSIEQCASIAKISVWTWMRWEGAKGSIPLERFADIDRALGDHVLPDLLAPHLVAA